MFNIISRSLLAVLLLSAAGVAQAQDKQVDDLSVRLIELRGQVDDLNNELVLLKEEHKQRMKFFYSQRSDLQSQIKREQASLKKLSATLEDNREQVKASGADASLLKPVVLDAIDSMQAHVERGLPFKAEERLAALHEIYQQLKKDVIPPQKAANRLWSFFEDEVRLSKETGLYRQAIELNGEQMLAEVARIGSVMMFFRTSDERLGRVVRQQDGWQYQVLQDEQDVERVAVLFDSLKKQIRTGYFELPAALSVEEAAL